MISAKSCPGFSLPPNAMVNPTNCTTGSSSPGTNCTIVCKTGYSLYGQSRVTCGTDGLWSGGNIASYVCRGKAISLTDKVYCMNSR